MKTITLAYPVELRGTNGEILETVREATLKRPNVKMLKAMDRAEGEVGKTAALIGACTGLPPSTVDLLDAADFGTLGEAVKGFMGASLVTGGKL